MRLHSLAASYSGAVLLEFLCFLFVFTTELQIINFDALYITAPQFSLEVRFVVTDPGFSTCKVILILGCEK